MKLARLGLAVVCAWLGLAAPDAGADEVPPLAQIIAVEGPVEWRGPGTANLQAARGGESLEAGALVRTGERAKARLRWRNGGEITVMPLGELVIAQADTAALSSGRLWARFRKKLLAPFFFRSPSATAVVRGTTLGVRLDPAGSTRIAVLEGRVEVAGASDLPGAVLEAGQAVAVSPEGALGAVAALDPSERTEMEAETRAANPGGPGERPNAPWGRFDDLTRRGLEWLERHRASDRLPGLRDETRPGVPPESRPPGSSANEEHDVPEHPEQPDGVEPPKPAGERPSEPHDEHEHQDEHDDD